MTIKNKQINKTEMANVNEFVIIFDCKKIKIKLSRLVGAPDSLII